MVNQLYYSKLHLKNWGIYLSKLHIITVTDMCNGYMHGAICWEGYVSADCTCETLRQIDSLQCAIY